MVLEELRARVESDRKSAALSPATLVELSECEPALECRTEPVRALLTEAAAALDQAGEPALEGRVLRRLAQLKMIEQDLDGAKTLAARARQRSREARDGSGVLAAAALASRIELRRGGDAEAQATLVKLAGIAEGAAIDERARVELSLAMAEVSLEEQGAEAEAEELFSELLAGVDGDDRLLDATFTCRQALGMLTLGRGDVSAACHHLRAVLTVAKRVGSVPDELRARIALGGALVARGDDAGITEAERHVQIARDKALEHGDDDMHTAALMGQAGLLAQKRRIRGALDRCLEIARSAAEKQDLRRYVAAVALMSEIYAQTGDYASAFRTVAESYHALRAQLGGDLKPLFEPQLRALADRVGPERLAALSEDAKLARALRDQLEARGEAPASHKEPE